MSTVATQPTTTQHILIAEDSPTQAATVAAHPRTTGVTESLRRRTDDLPCRPRAATGLRSSSAMWSCRK